MQFYRTSKPNNIDFLYEMPENAMLKAVENTDARLDNINAQADLFHSELGKVRYLPQDRDRVKELTSAYNSQIDELTKSIATNPADYRRKLPVIRDLSRKLTDEFSNGEIAKIQSNYQSYADWLKEHTERANKGEIGSNWFDKARESYMNQFQGTKYNPETGLYNSFNTSAVPKSIDIGERVDKWLKDVEASSSTYGNERPSGKWLVETEHGKEWVDRNELEKIALNRVKGDDELKNYLKFGQKIGVWQNPAEEALVPSISAAVDKYSYVKAKDKQKLSVNPYEQQRVEQAFRKSLQEDNQQFQREQQERRFDNAKDMQIAELEGKAKNGDKAAQGTLDYLRNGGKSIKLIGDVYQEGFEQATHKDDRHLAVQVEAELNQAQKEGNRALITEKNAELHDINNRIGQAETTGWRTLRSKYPVEQVNKFMDYIFNRNNYRSQLHVPKLPSSDSPDYFNALNASKNELGIMKKMEKDYASSINNYYKEINKHKVDRQGLSLTGNLSDIKTTVADFIKSNPERFALRNQEDGQVNDKATVAFTEGLKDGSIKPDDIKAVVNSGGSAFVVNYKGKKYLGKFTGNSNIDNVIADRLKGVDDSKAKSFVNQISDFYTRSFLGSMDKLTPGQSTLIPVTATGENKEHYNIDARVTKTQDGYYNVEISNNNGIFTPLFDVPMTKERAAEELSKSLH